ncbi:probable serine/threonine-protein kinase PIX13 isoform X2 [Rutidosis leptorrhynchoides]|uniref:probable serine/threonine-protein kinase PIX13 isoform X2 n=1 Tax=Rutidosis leptorrhynchoides TaxID=125765 RepID=UPI003A994840
MIRSNVQAKQCSVELQVCFHSPPIQKIQIKVIQSYQVIASPTMEMQPLVFLLATQCYQRRESSADSRSPILMIFPFADLKKATRNFSPDLRLGRGGFGDVFLGWLDPYMYAYGDAVAVERHIVETDEGRAEWQAKLSFLGRLSHPNIISLLGYCSHEQEHLLVYEYMPKKSLKDVLFKDISEPLSWGTRLTIMIGVARGLTYLHSLKAPVIFRDLKSSNILLDADFNSKLTNFGLAKCIPVNGETYVTATLVLGTYGYADPAYIATGHLCVKSDIYSFGVVLLETLTGLQVIDQKRPKEKNNLVEWVRPSLERRKKLKKIMDPRLEQNYPLEGAFRCTALTLRCLENFPKDRPSSEEVLRSLEQIYMANK